jgi:hypothetical protein
MLEDRMTDREIMQQALEALEWFTASEPGDEPPINSAIAALRERLAQPEQEPVAHVFLVEPDGRPRVAWENARDIKIGDKLYTSPPQRKPLTADEIEDLSFASIDKEYGHLDVLAFARAIEAAHGIKGEA